MNMRPPNRSGHLAFLTGLLLFLTGGCSAQPPALHPAADANPAPQSETSPASPDNSGGPANDSTANTAPPNTASQPTKQKTETETETAMETVLEKATFGAGCFWCSEAVFQQLQGVHSVTSGFMGGTVNKPSYKQICSGSTGHAEVIRIEFDPGVISFPELLEVFWKTHDPTTLNRQGNDVGTQYRSAVFYHTEQQRELASEYKKKLDDAHAFSDPIVTEITAASKLYAADEAHQDFFDNNRNTPYCQFVIPPKLEKLREVFGHKLKDK